LGGNAAAETAMRTRKQGVGVLSMPIAGGAILKKRCGGPFSPLEVAGAHDQR
jgi:hypothetical protein